MLALWVCIALAATGEAGSEVDLRLHPGDLKTRGYLDADEIESRLRDVAGSHGDIARLVDLSDELGEPTAEGRHLLAVRLSARVAADEDEPAILVTAGVHARELVPPAAALAVVERLAAGYGSDPDITAVLDEHEVWIVPLVNPDGNLHVFSTERMWRKNRRDLGDTRGVDINRNFPTGWSSTCAGPSDPADRRYRGPLPASEPETRTLMNLIRNERVAKLLDVHSYGRTVLRGRACSKGPLDGFLEAEARLLSHAVGFGGAQGPPSAEGELFEWAAEQGAHAFLMEIGTEFQPPMAPIEAESQRVYDALMHIASRPMASGWVRDRRSGEPLVATLVADDGAQWPAGGDFGRFDAVLPEGEHDVEVEADGYRVAAATVVTGDAVEVELLPVRVCAVAPAATWVWLLAVLGLRRRR